MNKKRWGIITRMRLEKWKIGRSNGVENYMDPLRPWIWQNAIRFEVQHYGTSLTKRMYLMRRWKAKIATVKDPELVKVLLEELCDDLARKVKWADLIKAKNGDV